MSGFQVVDGVVHRAMKCRGVFGSGWYSLGRPLSFPAGNARSTAGRKMRLLTRPVEYMGRCERVLRIASTVRVKKRRIAAQFGLISNTFDRSIGANGGGNAIFGPPGQFVRVGIDWRRHHTSRCPVLAWDSPTRFIW